AFGALGGEGLCVQGGGVVWGLCVGCGGLWGGGGEDGGGVVCPFLVGAGVGGEGAAVGGGGGGGWVGGGGWCGGGRGVGVGVVWVSGCCRVSSWMWGWPVWAPVARARSSSAVAGSRVVVRMVCSGAQAGLVVVRRPVNSQLLSGRWWPAVSRACSTGCRP